MRVTATNEWTAVTVGPINIQLGAGWRKFRNASFVVRVGMEHEIRIEDFENMVIYKVESEVSFYEDIESGVCGRLTSTCT